MKITTNLKINKQNLNEINTKTNSKILIGNKGHKYTKSNTEINIHNNNKLKKYNTINENINPKNSLNKKDTNEINLNNNLDTSVDRRKSHAVISNINPKKRFFKEDTKNNIKNFSILPEKINENQELLNEQEEIGISEKNISRKFSILSNNIELIFDNPDIIINNNQNLEYDQKENFNFEISKMLENEIHTDDLLDNIDLYHQKENIQEEKKSEDFVNNTSGDEITTSRINNKSVDTDDKNRYTPNFSPLNIQNKNKFIFEHINDNKYQKIFILVLKSR